MLQPFCSAAPPASRRRHGGAIGSLGYGISIWLDLLALRDLGAAREAVLFSTASP